MQYAAGQRGFAGGPWLGLVLIIAGLLLGRIWHGRRAAGWMLVFLVGLSLIRVALILYGPVDLSGDEAQYWDWSRHLDWSYYSKGPGVAVAIRLGTALLGNTVLGVRAQPWCWRS